MLAPQPHHTACLQVLGQAILDCRVGFRAGRMPAGQAEALMDGVHNIPGLLEKWDTCDLGQLRAELTGYHAVWAGCQLLTVFERALAEPAGSSAQDDRPPPAETRT